MVPHPRALGVVVVIAVAVVAAIVGAIGVIAFVSRQWVIVKGASILFVALMLIILAMLVMVPSHA